MRKQAAPKFSMLAVVLWSSIAFAFSPQSTIGYIKNLEVSSSGGLSIQLSSTIGGPAISLCVGAGNTLNANTSTPSPYTNTPDGINDLIAVATAAKLAGRQVTIEATANDGASSCRLGYMMMN